MKRHFIINPHSGRGLSARAVAKLQEHFTRQIGAFEYTIAESREAAIDATRKSLRDGTDQIVAVGGDGTANAVTNGFFDYGEPIRPQSSLVVGSAGTGSDYFKTIVAGRRGCDWRELVLRHVARPVDVGRIEYADPALCDQYFLNMASVGMIAEVVRGKNRLSRRLPQVLRYLLPTVGCFFSYRPRPMQVTTDSGQRDSKLLAVSIAKGIHAGGGMRLGGGATLCDGRFDVTLFGAFRPVEMLLKVGKLYTGRFENEAKIEEVRTQRISIRASEPLPVEFDGEVYGHADVEVTVVPAAIHVCFPIDSR